jgi:hypothetical protein
MISDDRREHGSHQATRAFRLRAASAMLWLDSTSRTASCLNSSVYLPRFPFLICCPFPYYSSFLRDTFCAGKVTLRVPCFYDGSIVNTANPPPRVPSRFTAHSKSFSSEVVYVFVPEPDQRSETVYRSWPSIGVPARFSVI